MNKNLLNKEYLSELTIAFKNKTIFKENDISLCFSPFQVCEIDNFLINTNEYKNLLAEIKNLEFCERNNDLYSFQQSSDLNNSSDEGISKFKNLLKGHFKNWLEDVSGIQLKPEINLTASKYMENDVLLCHDDELDTRRIAFTYYLTPEHWKKDDGGLLKLFEINAIGEPEKIVKEILPTSNKLIWFEVSESSYHEVSEVMSKTDARLSLHGWFHSEPVPRKPRPKDLLFTFFSPIHIELELVYSWINAQYLDPAAQDKIKEKFENQSEIQLPNFLKKDKYFKMLKILSDENVPWDAVGPPNKRNYNRLTSIENCEISSFLDLFKSEAMMLILSNITGLNFHPLYEEKNPATDDDGDDIPNKKLKSDDIEPNSPSIRSRLSYEIRRWSLGNYQLMHDADSHHATSDFSLDAFMYFTDMNIDYEVGGYTSYVSSDDGEQLLTVEPNKNCLNLVYKEKDTHKFVKYINNKINELNIHNFYDVNFSYFE